MFLMIYQNSPKNILDMRSDKFDSQLDRKVKPGSLLSLMCMFPESNKTKFWSPIFHLQNSGTLQTRMDQCGRRHENEFWQFSNTKVNIREQLELKDKIKNGVSCLVSFFPSWVMVLKLPKIVHFCTTCVDLSKKSKSINAIYLYPPKILHHALSENSIFYRGMSNSSRDSEE